MAQTKRKTTAKAHANTKKTKTETGFATSPSEGKIGGEVAENNEEEKEWTGWATVESEPAIFTELIKEFGVAGVNVQELYDTDESTLRSLSGAHGIIFLFRWKAEPVDEDIETTCPEGIWFANQVIDNACASLAMLNIIFNSCAELGPTLSSFKDFATPLTPPLKGLAVANNPYLRNIHNSFARQSEMRDLDLALLEATKSRSFMTAKPEMKGSKKKAEEIVDEVFHFIAYVHVNGVLWELDGLKKQPVRMLSCPKDEWTIHVGPTVRERITRYPEGECLFNLLAVVSETQGVDEEFAVIARKRKVDYEAFVHKAITILGRKQITKKML